MGELSVADAELCVSYLLDEGSILDFSKTSEITRLGSGSNGHVFRIKENEGKCAAVKITRKLDEGEYLYLKKQKGGLYSPTLMKIYSITSLEINHQTKYLIASEYCGGKSLEELQPGEEGIEFWKENTLPILNGLKAMHDRDISHGDIKPANIMMSDTGPKLIDFGFAKELKGGTGCPLEPAGRGTPAFAASELWSFANEDSANYNAKTADYWALGISIYTGITGKYPYDSINPKIGKPKPESSTALCQEFLELGKDSKAQQYFREGVRAELDDLKVPSVMIEILELLLEPDRTRVPSIEAVIAKATSLLGEEKKMDRGMEEKKDGDAEKRKEGDGGAPATEKKNNPATDIIIDLMEHKEMERVSEEAEEISKALLSCPPGILAPNSRIDIEDTGVTIDGKPVEILGFNDKCSIYSFEGAGGRLMTMKMIRGKAKQGKGFSLIWEEQGKGLVSPALAELHHFTETDSHHVLVFDPIDDGSFLETMFKKNERISFLNRNTLAILGALETLHRHNIFHGCLREDIFIVAEGTRALIFGFECARKFGTDGTLASAESMKIWAPYRPPEICDFQDKNEKFVAGSVSLRASRVDSWALGVIFLKMVTGKFPHEFIPPLSVATTDKNPSAATVMAELYRSPQTQGYFRRKLRNALNGKAPSGMAVVTVLLLEPNTSIALTIRKIREIAELIGALDALREKRYNESEIKGVIRGVLEALADNLLEAKYASEPIEGILKEAKETLAKYTAEPEKTRETGEEKEKGEKNRNEEAEKNGVKDPQNPQAPQNPPDVLTLVTENIDEATREKTKEQKI